MDGQDGLPTLDGTGAKEIVLRLYVAGAAPNSVRAIENLKALCRLRFPDRCSLEIVDVLKDPLAALADDILVTPTLLKLAPEPKLRVIGDLSDATRLLSALTTSEPL